MEAIKVGDLVQIVRTGRCCEKSLGFIFRVTRIRPRTGKLPYQFSCHWCGASGIASRPFDPTLVAEGYAGPRGMPLRRLKRIPPLAELESAMATARTTATHGVTNV